MSYETRTTCPAGRFAIAIYEEVQVRLNKENQPAAKVADKLVYIISSMAQDGSLLSQAQ